MKDYDPSKPLIHLHIPKTGGTSVRKIYRSWFGDGLLFHYFQEIPQEMPAHHDLPAKQKQYGEICVYGHFNQRRNFGVKQYYPEVNQFVTLMRDPFEMAVSAYFYLTTRPEYWRNSPIQVPQGTLEEFLLGKNGAKGILRYFPGKLTRFNYQNFLETHFIEVGVLEHLEESMRRIGEKLNKPFDPAMIEVLNPADRSQRVPYELRDAYREKCILPFLMYEYALSRYE